MTYTSPFNGLVATDLPVIRVPDLLIGSSSVMEADESSIQIELFTAYIPRKPVEWVSAHFLGKDDYFVLCAGKGELRASMASPVLTSYFHCSW